MSQAALGKLVGVSAAAISFIEGGVTVDPGYITLERIAAALGVTLPEILSGSHKANAAEELKAMFVQLSPEQQTAITITVQQLLAQSRKR